MARETEKEAQKMKGVRNGVCFVLMFFLVLTLIFGWFQFVPQVKAQESGGSFGDPTVPDIAFVNWTRFWSLFNTHSAWDLEYNDGTGWISIKSDLQIIKNYTRWTLAGYVPVNKTEATDCKITLNFTASYTADYRLTFGIDLNVKNYTHKESSWNYTLSYKNYTVVFDWSDIKDLPLDYVGHGIKPVGDESWFWFRVRKNNVQQGKNVIIDPSFGWETTEASAQDISDCISGVEASCTETGTADSITIQLASWGSGEEVKCALYNSTLDFVAETEAKSTGGDAGWHTFNFEAPKPSLTAQDYWIVAQSNSPVLMYYGAESGWNIIIDLDGFRPYEDGFPSDISNGLFYANYVFAAFCNYTTEAGESYIADLSQALSTSWQMLPQSSIIISLTQSLSTAWSVLTQCTFNIIPSFSLSTSWQILTQTSFNIVSSLSNTFSWLLDIAHTIGGVQDHIVDLSQAFSTTWTVAVEVVHLFATREFVRGYVLAVGLFLGLIFVPLIIVLFMRRK